MNGQALLVALLLGAFAAVALALPEVGVDGGICTQTVIRRQGVASEARVTPIYPAVRHERVATPGPGRGRVTDQPGMVL